MMITKNGTSNRRARPEVTVSHVREEARPRLYGRLTLASGRRDRGDTDA